MHMVYKIVTGKDKVDRSVWFKMAGQGERVTRISSDPLNVRVNHGRLDVRRNFFSVCTTSKWNCIPCAIKQLKTVAGFKNAYAEHRLAMNVTI